MFTYIVCICNLTDLKHCVILYTVSSIPTGKNSGKSGFYILEKFMEDVWRAVDHPSRMLQDLLPREFTDSIRRFNPYDRNLTRPITSKPVIGTILSPAIGILQDQLITGVIWWKIVFIMLFVLVTGVANWVFL